MFATGVLDTGGELYYPKVSLIEDFFPFAIDTCNAPN
jgi:hypothetical protein